VLHKDVLTVSYLHRFQIKKTFSDILGLDGIEHFSLDLVRPDGEMLFLSGTPQHCFEICNRGLGKFDGIISKEYYTNFEFYWWNDASHKAYSQQIKQIRENIIGLKHGFMLVRKWDNFHLIYSFATKRNDNDFQSQVINKLNSYLKMGDYIYKEMREIYYDYCGFYEPPQIESFFPFEGGIPPSRFTQNFLKKTKNFFSPDTSFPSNIIKFNFRDNISE